MATRLRKGIAVASSSSTLSVSKQIVDEASPVVAIIFPSLPKVRWASSSSEGAGETPVKPKKKMQDRLSGVIDAVNDRKLPPELRGQRNNIRYTMSSLSILIYRNLKS